MAIEQLTPNETAQQAFRRLYKETIASKNGLEEGLSDLKMASMMHPGDWGVVGSMAHVAYHLEEIARFLNHRDGK